MSRKTNRTSIHPRNIRNISMVAECPGVYVCFVLIVASVFVLDCSSENLHHILSQAQQVGMMTGKFISN